MVKIIIVFLFEITLTLILTFKVLDKIFFLFQLSFIYHFQTETNIKTIKLK